LRERPVRRKGTAVLCVTGSDIIGVRPITRRLASA
jgi:hypothetical protein